MKRKTRLVRQPSQKPSTLRTTIAAWVFGTWGAKEAAFDGRYIVYRNLQTNHPRKSAFTSPGTARLLMRYRSWIFPLNILYCRRLVHSNSPNLDFATLLGTREKLG